MKGIKKIRRKYVTLIVLGGIFLFLIGVSLFLRDKMEVSDLLETIYYLTQICSGFVVIVGVIIAAWQYVLTSRCEMSHIQTRQVQKAIDLSEYYKDNILHYYQVIKYVYEQSEILDSIKNIKTDDIEKFTFKEAKKLYRHEDIIKIQKHKEEAKFLKAILEANEIYNLDLSISDIEEKVEVKDGRNKKDVQVDSSKIIISFMNRMIMKTLNNLEFFSMHFTHNTADESVVYQSLHHTYIGLVEMLYYNICKQNQKARATFYTNVIGLYKTWDEKKEMNDSEYDRITESIVTKGTVCE
jgi:hypothetical protein